MRRARSPDPPAAWRCSRILTRLINRLELSPAGRAVGAALVSDLCSQGWTFGEVYIDELAEIANVTPTTVGRELRKFDERGVLAYSFGRGRGRLGRVEFASEARLTEMLAERSAPGPPENSMTAREFSSGKPDDGARVLAEKTRAKRAEKLARNGPKTRAKRAENSRAARDLGRKR